MHCYQLSLPSLLTALSTLSTAASLFTLVFGGCSMAFALLLSRARSVSRVRLLYSLPVLLWVAWLVMFVLGMLTSTLAIFTPITLGGMLCAEIRIRMILMERRDKGTRANN